MFLESDDCQNVMYVEEDEAISNMNETLELEDISVNVIKWKNYSCFYKLIRCISYLKKITHRWRAKANGLTPIFQSTLTIKDIQHSEKLIVKWIQEESYLKDIKDISKGKATKNRKLLQLQPIIKDQLLCVGGRLKYADIPPQVKHQIILPSSHYVSFLILKSIHEKNFHCGREQLLCLSRQKYWIINGKNLSRKVIFSCLNCKRERIKPSPQLMGDLPNERLSYSQPPFSHTGIDYFGPVFIKRGRRTKSFSGQAKRYVCFFTCLTFRAIHLELCEDLSTDDFIMALRRFISRRGYPKTIISDNGTNLVGANNELKRSLKNLNQTKINNTLIMQNIEWKLIPPGSPWMGGAWESMVKITKRALKTVTNGRPVFEQQLNTVLIEIEGTINSRPLTSISEDINDFETLTPNHFLLGRPNLNHSPGFFNEDDLNCRKKWKVTQAMLEIFWRRFLKEYIPLLTIRHRWNKLQRNFRINDIVLVQTDNIPRAFWPLGRILETYESRDGNIRSVKLKLPNSTLTRPVNKICLLEEAE